MKEKFCSHFVNEIEIKKLMQGLNSKKATAIDTIFQKLIKEAVDFFTPLLTIVVPLNKGKPSKN